MIKRKLFIKKKYKINLFLILPFLLLFIFFFYFLMINSKNEYFEVDKFIDPFYIIPSDKGGFQVKNLDKKSLHLSDNVKNENIIQNDFIYEYSIQVFASNDYKKISNKYIDLLNKNKKLNFMDRLNPNDFYIVTFNNDLGNEYILLYKNFETRAEALDYCKNYHNILPKCLIINVKNID